MYVTTNASELIKEKTIKHAEEMISAQSEQHAEDEPLLIDGFIISAKQCRQINKGERAAIDKFFKDNDKRLKMLARVFLWRNGIPVRYDFYSGCYTPAIIEIDDCINQLYVDLRSGYIVFTLTKKSITSAICHSFRYAGCGGFGAEDGAFIKVFAKRCKK